MYTNSSISANNNQPIRFIRCGIEPLSEKSTCKLFLYLYNVVFSTWYHRQKNAIEVQTSMIDQGLTSQSLASVVNLLNDPVLNPAGICVNILVECIFLASISQSYYINTGLKTNKSRKTEEDEHETNLRRDGASKWPGKVSIPCPTYLSPPWTPLVKPNIYCDNIIVKICIWTLFDMSWTFFEWSNECISITVISHESRDKRAKGWKNRNMAGQKWSLRYSICMQAYNI